MGYTINSSLFILMIDNFYLFFTLLLLLKHIFIISSKLYKLNLNLYICLGLLANFNPFKFQIFFKDDP